MKTNKRRTRWLLVVLLLLAAAIRVYWGTRPRVVWGDEPFYLWLGQSLLSGAGYQFFGISGVHFSPLFPLLAGLVARTAGFLTTDAAQALAAGSVAWYVICGTLLVLPVYGIARRLTGRMSGLCAALAAALYPALTAGVPLWGTMTEPLYLLLVATAWWALLVAQQEGRRWGYAAAGTTLGLAYLTRTEALVYLVAGLGAALIIALLLPDPSRGRAAGIKETLIGGALAVVVFTALISPYLIVLRAETGQWQLMEEAGSTYVSAQGLARNDVATFDSATWSLDPTSGEVYLFAPTSESQGLLSAIAADPRTFLRLLRGNLADLLATAFSAELVPLWLAALAALGLFARPWDARRLRGEFLLAASLAGSLSFLPFFIQTRYLAGALIPALVWIGEGTAWLGEWLTGSWANLRYGGTAVWEYGSAEDEVSPQADAPTGRHTPTILRLTPALLLALALLLQQPRMWTKLQRTNSFQPGHLAAAAGLRAAGASADAVVMSRYPAIAFHAGTRWTPTPAATWPQVEAYARRHEVDYLAVDAWEIKLRPQLNALLDPVTAPAELEHLATIDSGTGPVVIYRLRP